MFYIEIHIEFDDKDANSNSNADSKIRTISEFGPGSNSAVNSLGALAVAPMTCLYSENKAGAGFLRIQAAQNQEDLNYLIETFETYKETILSRLFICGKYKISECFIFQSDYLLPQKKLSIIQYRYQSKLLIFMEILKRDGIKLAASLVILLATYMWWNAQLDKAIFSMAAIFIPIVIDLIYRICTFKKGLAREHKQ